MLYRDDWGDLWSTVNDTQMRLVEVRGRDVTADDFVADNSFIEKEYGPLVPWSNVHDG